MTTVLPEDVINNGHSHFISASVLVFPEGYENKILLSERLKWPYLGTWGPPSGKSKIGESPKQTALRELHEETGIILLNSRISYLGIVPHVIEKFGFEVFMSWIFVAELKPYEQPRWMEKSKMREWHWFYINDFPSPLFPLVHPMLSLLNTQTT